MSVVRCGMMRFYSFRSKGGLAAEDWKYQPYLTGGEPTEVETSVEISFTL